MNGDRCSVTDLAFAPSGRRRVLASAGNDVRLWAATEGRPIQSLGAYQKPVWSVAYDPEGHLLASAGEDGFVKIWDVAGGTESRTIQGTGYLYRIAFDPRGRILACAGMHETVDLWDTVSGRLVRRLEGHTKSVSAVAYSPINGMLASKGFDHTVRIWWADGGECVAVIPEPAFGSAFAGLAFHPALPRLATVGSDTESADWTLRDRVIHIWELSE